LPGCGEHRFTFLRNTGGRAAEKIDRGLLYNESTYPVVHNFSGPEIASCPGIVIFVVEFDFMKHRDYRRTTIRRTLLYVLSGNGQVPSWNVIVSLKDEGLIVGPKHEVTDQGLYKIMCYAIEKAFE